MNFTDLSAATSKFTSELAKEVRLTLDVTGEHDSYFFSIFSPDEGATPVPEEARIKMRLFAHYHGAAVTYGEDEQAVWLKVNALLCD
jgi:hypothetical protein